jgi:protein SCO1/2
MIRYLSGCGKRVRLRGVLLSGTVLLSATLVWASEQRYSAKGMILKVDPLHKTMTVSCQAIPGFMEATSMPLAVRDASALKELSAGTTISFTLVVDKDGSHAESIQAQSYQGVEVDPLTARRLKLLNQATNPKLQGHELVELGKHVPDFTLLDQDRHRIREASFTGKVVALNFIYTRCALPDFCFRTANNFGLVQKRFKDRLGTQLILLTVSFDPTHDQPEALRKYAGVWKADAHSSHLLTGPPAEVQRVCDMFGLDAFLDEGLMDHSLHTVVIDQNGNLAANVEGNQFTADQLGELIQTVLDRGR